MLDFDLILRIITASGIVSLVGLWWRRDVALRKIASSEAGDLRDAYAKELAAVRSERQHDREQALVLEKYLRGMIEDSDRRHEECETARRAMRNEMDGMHDEIRGLKRQIPDISADRLVLLEGSRVKPSDTAPYAAASAARVKSITENGK